MSKFLEMMKNLIEETIVDSYVVNFSEGPGDIDRFSDKNGKIIDNLENAVKFPTMKDALAFFEKHFPGYTNFKERNDEYYTAKWKGMTVQILDQEHFE